MVADAEIFDRETKVTVGTLEVSELQVAFKVQKTLAAEPNTCDVVILNLSPKHRALISEFNADKGKNRTIPVRIEAGYKSTGGAVLIFEGELRETKSQKQGATWTTTVSAGDGETSVRIARMNASLPVGSQPYDIVRAILRTIGLGYGNVSKFSDELRSGGEAAISLSGAASYHLTNWTRPFGLRWSIQNGAPFFSKNDQPGVGRVVKLTPDSGLIGSAVAEANGRCSCTARILPDLDIGNVFALESASLSGNFKIDAAAFSGNTRGGEYQIKLEGSKY